MRNWLPDPPDLGPFRFGEEVRSAFPPGEARRRLLERLEAIRARFASDPRPLPPRSEMSVLELLATASTSDEVAEALDAYRERRR
jgi:hypothetical protein